MHENTDAVIILNERRKWTKKEKYEEKHTRKISYHAMVGFRVYEARIVFAGTIPTTITTATLTRSRGLPPMMS